MFFLEGRRLLLWFRKSLIFFFLEPESLEKVQRRAISMTSGLRSLQSEEKLRELRLEERHQLDMTQTFKILEGVNKSNWFKPASEGQVRVKK
jgi:hypothetical protein